VQLQPGQSGVTDQSNEDCVDLAGVEGQLHGIGPSGAARLLGDIDDISRVRREPGPVGRLEVRRLPSRVDRDRSMLGHTNTSVPVNPLAPPER
jgi:hypothetical protein